MAKKNKVNIYEDMRLSLADALAYERGQKIYLREREIPAHPGPQTMRNLADPRKPARKPGHIRTLSLVSVQRLCRAGGRASLWFLP